MKHPEHLKNLDHPEHSKLPENYSFQYYGKELWWPGDWKPESRPLEHHLSNLYNLEFQPLTGTCVYMICTYKSITKQTKIYTKFVSKFINTCIHWLRFNHTLSYKFSLKNLIENWDWRMEQQCLGNLLHGQNVDHCGNPGHHFRTFNSMDAVLG